MESQWDVLERQKTVLLKRSLATSSLSTYKTGIKQYLAFCRDVNRAPVPLDQDTLENFVVLLSSRVGYKAIKVYLYGVQYWSKLQGCSVLIKKMERLKYVVKGVRRAQGKAYEKGSRPPITWLMLQKICSFIFRVERPFDRDMLTSASLLAFFGLLRVSEYTCPSSTQFDEEDHLAPSDANIVWDRNCAFVYIKKSKTDPWRDGVRISFRALFMSSAGVTEISVSEGSYVWPSLFVPEFCVFDKE